MKYKTGLMWRLQQAYLQPIDGWNCKSISIDQISEAGVILETECVRQDGESGIHGLATKSQQLASCRTT